MQIPLQVSFHGVAHSEALYGAIRKRVAELERFYDRIVSCRVVLELGARQHRNGKQYSARIDEKFSVVSEQIKSLGAQGAKYGEDVLRLERELSALRLEMMRDFTRREDHNQAIASIRVGLDNMSLRIEKALSTGGRLDA